MSTGGTHLKANLGPTCRRCTQTEARCAYLGGCCGHCSHWRRYTTDGEIRQPEPPVTPQVDILPVCSDCGRRVTERGRNDCPGLCADRQRGYWRDRKRAAS